MSRRQPDVPPPMESTVVASVSRDPTAQISVDLPALAVMLVIALTLLVMLRVARDFFVPLATGLVLRYALDPLVSFLVRRRVPRAVSAAIVMVSLVAAVGATVYSLSDEVATVIEELPVATQKLRQAARLSARQQNGTLQQLSKAATDLERAASDATARTPPQTGITRVQIVEPAVDVAAYVRWGSAGAVSFAAQLVLLVFLVFFLLASGDQYKRKLVRLAGPTMVGRRVTVQILDEINTKVEHFLLHLAFASALVGLTTGLAFWLMGVQQPAVWGLAAGILNTIPYFGPIVMMAASALVAMMQFGSIEMMLLVAGVSVAVTSVEGFLLTPWLMSRASRMNAVAVFVSLLFWGWMWGLWGVLLATPILMALKTVAEHIEEFQPVAEVLAE